MQVFCTCSRRRRYNHKRDGHLSRLRCECGLVGEFERMPGLPTARQSRRAPDAAGAPAPFGLTPARAALTSDSPAIERASAVDWRSRALLAESQASILKGEVAKLRAELAVAAKRIGDLELDLHHERAAARLEPAQVQLRILSSGAGDEGRTVPAGGDA